MTTPKTAPSEAPAGLWLARFASRKWVGFVLCLLALIVLAWMDALTAVSGGAVVSVYAVLSGTNALSKFAYRPTPPDDINVYVEQEPIHGVIRRDEEARDDLRD